jgi:hypothetical protein
MKDFLLMTIKWDLPKKIDAQSLAKKLNVDVRDLDDEFGIVSVDDKENIYSYRITMEGYNKSNLQDKKDYGGPFSDTKIEPFGLE